MAELARWTTPSISYKPNLVELAEVDEIYLVIKQAGSVIVEKSKEDAEIINGAFRWRLTQLDSSKLKNRIDFLIYIDYTDIYGLRYTIDPKRFNTTDSGKQEVI